MARVGCIFGTESGGSERHARRLSKAWAAAGVKFDAGKDIIAGNDAASMGLAAVAEKYAGRAELEATSVCG